MTLLVVAGLGVSLAWAHEGMGSGKGKSVTLKGVLVDTNCYLKYGHDKDDHDSMKACGKACLKDGVPAGLLVDKKLYVIIFPASVFADYIGKTVEITGTLYGDSSLVPEKASSGPKPIKLKGKVMM